MKSLSEYISKGDLIFIIVMAVAGGIASKLFWMFMSWSNLI